MLILQSLLSWFSISGTTKCESIGLMISLLTSSFRSLQINSFSYQFFLVVVAGCYRHVVVKRSKVGSEFDSTLLQLLQKVWWLEIFRDWIVHARDDFVDWLLPWLLSVLSALDSAEELTQCLFNDKPEVWWNLKAMKRRNLVEKFLKQ